MTTIQVMLTTSLANVKAKLSSYVDTVQSTHERVIITRNGEPVAVLVSPDELESLEETIELLSDPQAVAEIAEAEDAIRRGEVYSLDDIQMRPRK